MFVVPSIYASSSWKTTDNDLVLRTVRELRLQDIQNKIQLATTPDLYRSYNEMTLCLQSLAMTYSDIMSLTSIGKTYEGRDLWMVKLSDNVSQEEKEPGILFMGAHYGNEKPSYEVCLFLIQYLVEQYENNSLPEIRDKINSTQIYVIPMVNPDDVAAGTRKNCAPNYGSLEKKQK